MFPNKKLYGHQPNIKLETGEPLPNRRKDIIQYSCPALI